MNRKIISIFLAVILSALLASCDSANATPNYRATFQPEITKTETGNTLIVTDNFTAVILTKDFYESHNPFVANEYWTPTTEYWTPELDQILYIEAHLDEFLAQNGSKFNSGNAPTKEKLARYGRQYYGTSENNQRIIIGQYFCLFNDDRDWKNYFVSVKGGGDCYFGVWYDPESRTFIALGVNSRE